MRHPFDGILPGPADEAGAGTPPRESRPDPARPPGRRTLLRAVAALALGGAGGLLAAPRGAAAQRVTTWAWGEEGLLRLPRGLGLVPPGHRRSPPPGHDGAAAGHRRREQATTQALDEEGAPPAREWDEVTTQAVGEEGGRQRRGRRARPTTEAMDEEGRGGGSGRAATEALGEDGGRDHLRF